MYGEVSDHFPDGQVLSRRAVPRRCVVRRTAGRSTIEAVVIGGYTDSGGWRWSEPNWGNGTEKVQGTDEVGNGFTWLLSLELARAV